MKLLFVKFPFGTEMRMSQQNHEGGWSGIGMATVGIHPNDFDLYPNKIPPGRVVQNCLIFFETRTETITKTLKITLKRGRDCKEDIVSRLPLRLPARLIFYSRVPSKNE